MKLARPKVMFCSQTAFEIHKAAFDTVGCIEKYIVYDETTPEKATKLKLLVEKHGGILYKDFLTETADLKDFVPVPVDGWKDYIFIVFSSGTTGLSKAVPWTHMGFVIMSMSIANDR